jgi:hypothetical protein
MGPNNGKPIDNIVDQPTPGEQRRWYKNSMRLMLNWEVWAVKRQDAEEFRLNSRVTAIARKPMSPFAGRPPKDQAGPGSAQPV